MLDSTGTVGTPYSSSISVTGTAPFTSELLSGTLPPGLTLSGATLSGTPTTEGTYHFNIELTNLCGSDQNGYGVDIYSSAVPDMVWGDDWLFRARYLIDEAADYAVFQPDSVNLVGVYQSATGLMYTNYGYLLGFDMTSRPGPDTALGPVHVHILGYRDDGAGWYEPAPGVEFTGDATCRMRIYCGELSALPSDPLTHAQVLALQSGDTADGVRITLTDTARNIRLDFPATSTPKYRVIAIPTSAFSVATWSSSPAATWTGNTFRYEDNTAPVLARSDQYSYVLGYSSGGYPLYYDVYFIDATADAFSIYLRGEVTTYQSFPISKSSNISSPIYYTTPWTEYPSFVKPADGTIISMNALTQIAWSGKICAENKEGVTRSYTITMTISVAFSTPVEGNFVTKQVSNTAVVSFGAFDTLVDYGGSSGYSQATQLKVSSLGTTTFSAARIAEFNAAPTTAITVAASQAITCVTGSTDNFGNTAVLAQDFPSSVHFTTLQVNYVYQLD